ncbi:MAG: hypothetical protein M3N93_01005 [Acidobacteriota bacterium]|nr:hypothetical protein [Acidobacteriota bacterium]
MRSIHVLSIAVVFLTGSLHAQNAARTLEWARENIDAHAVTHHLEPPAKISGAKWEVVRIEGCTVELKQTLHREAPDAVVKGDGVFGFSEDKVVTWTFALSSLRPHFVMVDTSTGFAHVQIFAEGDAFQLKTESTSRLLNKDGTIESTSVWSNTGNARNLLMYFDSPKTDNKVVVRRIGSDLKMAVAQCSQS